MKLTVFRSGKGDSLLLTAQNGANILVDGGIPAAYSEHVSPTMGQLAAKKKALDLVCISHIDSDHIGGILRMLDDEVDWRVHDFQVAGGNPSFPKPKSVRPPKIKKIWHNAFQDQVEKNLGEIESLLVNQIRLLSFDGQLRDEVDDLHDLVTSERQALLVSNRVSDRQLNIPLNPEFGGKLMLVADPPDSIHVGSIKLSIIGPFKEDLDNLRYKWNKWVEDNQEAIRKIQEQAREDAERLGLDDGVALQNTMLALAKELGDRNAVTPANLASLMLLAEEGGKTVLLTGDGHADEILAGLDVNGKLDAAERIHVNVLKVQHHGSEHNLDKPFAKRITADNYAFCGDGSHENPEPDVVEAVIDSRLGSGSNASDNPAAAGTFKLWFNSSEKLTTESNQPHMKELEKLVKKRAGQSGGRMKFRFLKSGSKFNVPV